MSVVIRRLQTTDPDVLADSFAADGRDFALFDGYLLEHLLERRLVLVALAGDDPVGYTTLVWDAPYTHFWRRRIPEIVDLYVQAAARRQGVGTALIQRCEREAAAKGFSAIGLSVIQSADYAPAERLYRALGYAPDGYGITAGDGELHLMKALMQS